MKTWYGSLNNRLEENKMFCDEITVGTGVTEYYFSDREAYEVIEVLDQKHVTIRRLDHEHVGDGHMDNNWKLKSNPENPTYNLVKRGNYWYSVTTFTSDLLNLLPTSRDVEWTNEQMQISLWMAQNDITPEELRRRGTIKRYHKRDVSFGRADYYYDYEF